MNYTSGMDNTLIGQFHMHTSNGASGTPQGLTIYEMA